MLNYNITLNVYKKRVLEKFMITRCYNKTKKMSEN